ncbi:hypothetical protein FACS189452_10220 [Bacteroidia bacterium]|nr:hypothetical protein FACS189452_10220 [Bacteroidia bacterium]GHT81320.1 hypothetical protein FACS189467_5180 [Bacteroidia bacterium]
MENIENSNEQIVRRAKAAQDNAKAHKDADKKSAKVIEINPSEIVDEGGNAIDLNNTEALRKWLLAKYQGKTVEVKDDGRKVLFAGTGLKDSAKRRGRTQRQLYADLEQLVESGIYDGYELGDSKHPNVNRQNIYFASAKIGNKVLGVRIKIDIFNGVEKGSYKDHKIAEIEIEKSPSLNKGFYSLQQDGDLAIAIPKIREAFDNKGTTSFSEKQENSQKVAKKAVPSAALAEMLKQTQEETPVAPGKKKGLSI